MKYTDLAPLVPFCCGCRKHADGTIRLAHRNLNGWGMLFGRGTKSLALCGAFICDECDLQYGESKAEEHRLWWEMAVQRSITWAWQNDHLAFIANSGHISKEALR